MPYLDVVQPTGSVVSESDWTPIDVVAFLPLTSTETLQIKVDGVDILEVLEPQFGLASKPEFINVAPGVQVIIAGRDAGSFSLSARPYWLAGRDAGSFSLSARPYWLAGRDAGSFSISQPAIGLDPFDNGVSDLFRRLPDDRYRIYLIGGL